MTSGRARPRALALAAVLAAASCRQGGGAEPLRVAPTPAYAAPSAPWPPAAPTARFGRGVAPGLAIPAPIAWGLPVPPVIVDRVWPVPGDGEALAVVSGMLGDRPAVELIGVDDGRVRWRSTTACAAPVVHVTRERIVCGDASFMRGLDVATGGLRWQQLLRFNGAEGDLAVGIRRGPDGQDGPVAVVRVSTGEVIAEAAPPGGIEPSVVHRACATADGVTMWAWSGAVARYQVTGGGTAGAFELLPVARPPARVDACDAPALVELPIPGSVERELLAIAPDGLRPAGPSVIERGFWRRADGHVVVATERGVEVRDAALAPGERVSDAQVGRSIDARGRRRLVRGAGGAPVLLEDDRPIAYLRAPGNVDTAALGDACVIGGAWQRPTRSDADHVSRWCLPDPGPPPAVPPLVPGAPLLPTAQARDLPPEVDLTAAPTIDQPDAGQYAVALAALDPTDPAILLAAPLSAPVDGVHGAGLAVLDLRARRWRWSVADGCPPGTPVALTATRDTIVCATRGSATGSGWVRAFDRDGAPRWTWHGATVDAAVAGGGLVVVTVGREAVVLDAADGASLATVAADDGFVPRIVPVALGADDLAIDVERGALVARLPRAGMLPLWATAIDGVVRELAVAGDRVAVSLADGELYLVDPATGAATAAAGWAARWRPLDGSDLLVADPAPSADPAWQVVGYGADGVARFSDALALEPPWAIGLRGRAAGAPLPLAFGPAVHFAALVDAMTGRVEARAALPHRAVTGAVFATVVDGEVVAGAVLSGPLGVVLFPR